MKTKYNNDMQHKSFLSPEVYLCLLMKIQRELKIITTATNSFNAFVP